MSNLSQTVGNTRKIIIGFVLFCVLVLAFNYLRGLISQERDTPVNNGLNSLYLSPTKISSDYTRFELDSLETLNSSRPEFVKVGDFASFPQSVNVYKVKDKTVLLSPLEKARKQADTLKLNENYETISSSLYRWRGGTNNLIMEFDTVSQKLRVTSNLQQNSQKNIKRDLTDEQLLTNTRSIGTQLEIIPAEIPTDSFRIDYISVDRSGSIVSSTKEAASLVRVTLFKKLESATLKNQTAVTTSKTPNTPQDVISEIRRPDILTGAVTFIFNNEAKSVDDIVTIDYTPSSYIEAVRPSGTTPQLNANIYDIDVYSTIELGVAFNILQSGQAGSSLVFLATPQENLFDSYIPLSVTKFTVDAKSTKLIYIEPEEYPVESNGKQKYIYPYYWFEGIASLDNGEQANFVFLVDAVRR